MKFPRATGSTKDQRFCDCEREAGISRGTDGHGCFIPVITGVTWRPPSTLLTDDIGCYSSSTALERQARWKEFLWGSLMAITFLPTEPQSRRGERWHAVPQHQRGTSRMRGRRHVPWKAQHSGEMTQAAGTGQLAKHLLGIFG